MLNSSLRVKVNFFLTLDEMQTMNKKNDNETIESVSIGEMLSLARQRRGASVEDVAKALKLSPQVVHSIENDSFDQFSARIYLRGYLRSYSKLIGLTKDENELLDKGILSLRCLDRQEASPTLSPVFESSAPTKRRFRLLSYGVALLFGVTAIYWVAGHYQSSSVLSRGVSTSLNGSKLVVSSASSIPLSLSPSIEGPATVAQTVHSPPFSGTSDSKSAILKKKKSIKIE